jgi:hypothetical protein
MRLKAALEQRTRTLVRTCHFCGMI